MNLDRDHSQFSAFMQVYKECIRGSQAYTEGIKPVQCLEAKHLEAKCNIYTT